ncbi:hypothetical protein FRC02_001757 [Tulasnella sp. 418]|nr:hypothetical protein FRC02_001757 [Tulasnella sp. 418]
MTKRYKVLAQIYPGLGLNVCCGARWYSLPTSILSGHSPNHAVCTPVKPQIAFIASTSLPSDNAPFLMLNDHKAVDSSSKDMNGRLGVVRSNQLFSKQMNYSPVSPT